MNLLFKPRLNPLFQINYQMRSIFHYNEFIAQEKTQKEAKLAKKIKKALHPTFVSVINTTISGRSCGQMYSIIVESPLFYQKSKVQQHKMVSEVLKDQFAEIHSFNLKTKIPTEQSDTGQKATQQKEFTKSKNTETEPNDSSKLSSKE